MPPRTISVAALTATITFAALPAAADAPSSDDTARWHAGLELDPIPFALGGYGGLLSVRPDRRWKIGVSSFSVPYPDGLISDDNAGFHLKIRPSGVVMVNYSLTTATRRGGWFVGGIGQLVRTRYTHDDAPGMSTNVTHIELGVAGGYVWYPFERTGLFLQAWGNVGHYVWNSATPTVDSHTYQQAWLIPYVTVHIGFEM